MASVATIIKSYSCYPKITCAALSPIELRRRVLQGKALVHLQMVELSAEPLHLPARRLSHRHTQRLSIHTTSFAEGSSTAGWRTVSGLSGSWFPRPPVLLAEKLV